MANPSKRSTQQKECRRGVCKVPADCAYNVPGEVDLHKKEKRDILEE